MNTESPEVCLISVGRVSVFFSRSWLKVNRSWLCCMLSRQLCPTLCSPMDCSPQGSSVHGILQARIWEWVGNNTHWGWLQIPKYKELFAPGIIWDLIHCSLGMNVLNLSLLMWVLIFNGGFVFLWWVWFSDQSLLMHWISIHVLNLCSCTESDILRGIWVPEWYFEFTVCYLVIME